MEIFLFLATDPPSLKLWRDKFRRYLWHKFTRIFWMQVLKCAGCAGVATGSILVYAYILIYYIKDRGFENQWFLSEGLTPLIID